jgi:Na+/melibiose symporter-like transporter
MFGFKAAAGVDNTPDALRTLELIYVGAPAVLTFLGLLAFIGYRLDKDSHARIQLQLAERDARVAPPAG